MSGLDKILNEIKEQSQITAQSIISDAKAEADAIYEKTMAQAASEVLKIEQNAKLQTDLMLKKAEGTKELNIKRIVLSKKQEIISSCINKAKSEIENASADEYFLILEKLIKKYATGEAGEIKFADKFTSLLPESIITLLKKSNLTISSDTVNTSGGFVLVYGNIEHNATFDAIFEANRSEISDKVYATIFN